ncbi:helix-turn-helix transcriptional regulator [Aquisphaera insulae]|uniref:helix-turn-helix transcriptional regulator n=1 Tax=Aquisphaera insulae TaxID=2712864 RepID=UPI0013EE27BE|nr:AraC family transcriptional regulator [Aquisphaera insulae]
MESTPRPSQAVATSLETDDFDRMAMAFARWDHRFEQLGRGAFRGRIAFADLDAVQLLDCEVNRAILCRGGRPSGCYTLSPVLAANADSRWRGRSLRPGMINVLGPRLDMDHLTSRPYRNTTLVVRGDLLERAAVGLIGVDFESRLAPGLGHDARAPELAPGLADALALRWRRALSRLARPGADRPEFDATELGLELASGLVRALAVGRVADPVRLAHSQRARVVRQAEEYARAHPPDRVSILVLCERAGVSERSLHYAFLEVTGMSPKAFLKALRLNAARRELLESDPGRGRIGEIALRHGFRRPGQFAADYRRQFGTLPSGAGAVEVARG